MGIPRYERDRKRYLHCEALDVLQIPLRLLDFQLTVQLLQRIRPMVYVTVCIIPTRAPFPPELLLSLT